MSFKMAWTGRSKRRTVGTQTMLDMAVIDKATEFFDTENEARWEEIAVSIEAPGLARRRSQGDLTLVVDPSGSAKGSPALRKALTINSMIESRVSHLEKNYAERIEELRLQNQSLVERLAKQGCAGSGSDSSPFPGQSLHSPSPPPPAEVGEAAPAALLGAYSPSPGFNLREEVARLLARVGEKALENVTAAAGSPSGAEEADRPVAVSSSASSCKILCGSWEVAEHHLSGPRMQPEGTADEPHATLPAKVHELQRPPSEATTASTPTEHPLSGPRQQFEVTSGELFAALPAKVYELERPPSEATTAATPTDRVAMSRPRPGSQQDLETRPAPREQPLPVEMPAIADTPQEKTSALVEEARSFMDLIHSELQKVYSIARTISTQLVSGSGLEKDVQKLLDQLAHVSKQVPLASASTALRKPHLDEAPVSQRGVPSPRGRCPRRSSWHASGTAAATVDRHPVERSVPSSSRPETEGAPSPKANRQLSPLPGGIDDRARLPALPLPIPHPAQQAYRRRTSLRTAVPLRLNGENVREGASSSNATLAAAHSAAAPEAASSDHDTPITPQVPQTARVRGRSFSSNVSLGLSLRSRSAAAGRGTGASAGPGAGCEGTSTVPDPAAAPAPDPTFPLVHYQQQQPHQQHQQHQSEEGPQAQAQARYSIGDTLQPLPVHLPPRLKSQGGTAERGMQWRHSRASTQPCGEENNSNSTSETLLRILSANGDSVTIRDTLDVGCPSARLAGSTSRFASTSVSICAEPLSPRSPPRVRRTRTEEVDADVQLVVEGKAAAVQDAAAPSLAFPLVT